MPDDLRTSSPPRRQRNRRGEGYRLREEIISGATAILERTGTEEALTLRAIAREIGVSAPSVSDHFVDRAAIIDAVVFKELEHLAGSVEEAAAAHADPVERYLALARAYLEMGRQHPARYRVLFERRYLPVWEAEQRPMTETAPLFASTFATVSGALQACIDAGRSESTDAVTDSVAVWFFLHGLVAIPAAITSFGWPDADELMVAGVTRLARFTASPVATRSRRRSASAKAAN